jgi:hypothetical protein
LIPKSGRQGSCRPFLFKHGIFFEEFIDMNMSRAEAFGLGNRLIAAAAARARTTKIITRGVLDWDGNVLEEDSYEYSGPLARAENFGNAQLYPLITACVNASAPTTASGSWVDCENFIGDVAVLVTIYSATGSFGSLAVQAQASAANTGASAASILDPRNQGLLTATAVGSFVLPIAVNCMPANFLGVACTYTGITAGDFSIELIAKKRSN